MSAMDISTSLFDSAIDLVAAIVLVLGQILPYIPQYHSIVQLKDSAGFSMQVPLVLITANILRLLFWLGKPFGLILVVQSIVMILTQLFLLQVCLLYKRREERKPLRLVADFWNWDESYAYYYVLIGVWAVASTVTFMFYGNSVYFEALGCTALVTEAVLGVPQLLKNRRTQSTAGLSVVMIYGWTFGDMSKTLYFLKKGEPLQFVACGIIQIAVDLWILGQVFTYGEKNASGKVIL